MEFTMPTTLIEMYDTLKEIFMYYRNVSYTMEEIQLEELSIPRITQTYLTDDELRTKATTLLKAGQQELIKSKQDEISNQIFELQKQLLLVTSGEEQRKQNLLNNYNKKKEEAIERFYNGRENFASYNSISVEYEQEYMAKYDELLEKIQQEKDDIQAQITLKQEELANVSSAYAGIFNYQIEKKFIELKDEQDALKIEHEKYNSTANEKEVKYSNSLVQTRTSLKLKLLEIKKTPLTREELIEYGYYADAISCIQGYLNTLSPSNAYNTLQSETKIMTYIDDFYQNLLYLYQTRALNS